MALFLCYFACTDESKGVRRMRKLLRRIFLTGLILFVGAQFIPVARTNPPITGDIPAPPEIKTLLRNACYDCHSHETVWPWYSRVAPVSWLVVSDTKEGRSKLNFSTWNDYKPAKQGVLLEDAAAQIEEGEMPILPYTWMHPNSRLTPAQKEQLVTWMKASPGN
jgi:hypothetical protein